MRFDIFPVLTVLSAFVCLMTAAALAVMLQSALSSGRERLRIHLLTTGIVVATAIWAAQFLALLAYSARYELTFLPGPAFASLALGVLGFGLSLEMFEYRRGRLQAAWAGLSCGLSTATIHFVGTMSVSFRGIVARDLSLAISAVVIGTLLSAVALPLLSRRDSRGPAALGIGFFAASMLSVHILGMQSIRLVRLDGIELVQKGIAPLELGLLVAFGSLLLGGWALSVSMSRHSFQRMLGRHTREFSHLVHGLRDTAICMIDTRGHVVSWNEGARRLTGFNECDILGRHFERFYGESERLRGSPADALKTALDQGAYKTRGYRYRKDGSRFWADVTMEPVYDHAKLIGFVKITHDITARIEAEEHLNQIRSDLEAATANMVQGLILYDAEGRVKMVNARLARIFGVPEHIFVPGMTEEEIGQATIRSRAAMRGSCDAEAERVAAKLKSTSRSEGYVQADVDEDLTVSINRRMLPNGGKVVTVEDVTDRHKAAERLQFMATHDALTGLLNREAFRRMLDAEFAMAPPDDKVLAVAIVDLDLFKEVNDIHGHAVGDALLQEVSARLEDAVGNSGIAARLGGDEFAVLARIGKDDIDCANFAARLTNAVNFTTILLHKAIQSAGSVGIAVAPDGGETTKALIGNADLAMYRAKTKLRGGWLRYNQKMGRRSREQRELQDALRNALDRDEFYLAYQSQCLVQTGQVFGYEALLRWRHERFGTLPPDRFVKAAEENGLILAIGEWVLRTACIEAAAWQAPHKLAVNISAIQLIQPDFHQLVTHALLESGLPADRLEIEITESVIITDKNRALHNLRRIKALGVSVAIDDFGTGYSSLDTLNSFEFDKIKIDRTFLMDAKRSEASRAIIRAVLALGRSLNLPVLAEGVESEEDLALLRAEQCGEAQGFYFGRPGAVECDRLSA